MKQAGEKFVELIKIIKRLRGPGGCPWDQKQTPESFKPYMLEEAHELAEAIDSEDLLNIKEELGDLFFQVIFINLLYVENEQFSVAGVLQGIINKMVRRHPHVFEEKRFSSNREMRENWLRVKVQEGKKEKNELDFPKSLPALTKTLRVTERAARNGFTVPDLKTLQAELDEKSGRLSRLIAGDCQQDMAALIGELLFILVDLGRLNGIDCEDALGRETKVFINRYNRAVQEDGKTK